MKSPEVVEAYVGKSRALFGTLDSARRWILREVEAQAAAGIIGASGWAKRPASYSLDRPGPWDGVAWRVRVFDQWGEPMDLGPFSDTAEAQAFADERAGAEGWDDERPAPVLVPVRADPEPCECNGVGYFASLSDGEGRMFLERCDLCRRFESDDDAAGAWAWDLAQGLPWAVTAAREILGGGA